MTITAQPGVPGPPATTEEPTIAEQAPQLLGHIAGYVAHRTIAMGLRSGLLQAFADQPGSTAEEVARSGELDAYYVSVWCR